MREVKTKDCEIPEDEEGFYCVRHEHSLQRKKDLEHGLKWQARLDLRR